MSLFLTKSLAFGSQRDLEEKTEAHPASLLFRHIQDEKRMGRGYRWITSAEQRLSLLCTKCNQYRMKVEPEG